MRHYPLPDPAAQLYFLQKLQQLLEEGMFTSTYKYARLLGLADLAVERGNIGGMPLPLSVQEITQKFIEYYWKQTVPYPSQTGQQTIVRQNRDRQAKVINDINAVRRKYGGSLSRAMQDKIGWMQLMRTVASTVKQMPLWRLQQFSHGIDEFLYRNTPKSNTITLNPGVAYNLRTFHGQIQNMVQGAWVRWIRQLNRNQGILGQNVNLDEFLFGSERSNLRLYEPFLREQQNNRCFYCRQPLRGQQAEVDHFIPWIRYPHDLAHNFVLAHPACNKDKRDFLPAVTHLERWVMRNQGCADLIRFFEDQHLVHDHRASHSVAAWAYEQVERVSGEVWIGARGVTETLKGDWLRLLAAI